MIVSALTAGAPSDTCSASGVSTLPPALASSVLNQTMMPSYWAPWISIRCGLPSFASWIESLIISSHVLRRVRHQVGAVPQQLGVAVVGHRVELAVPDGGLQRDVQGAVARLLLVGARPRQDPARLGELGLPGHVEAEDVHRAVAGGEPADHLLRAARRRRSAACCTRWCTCRRSARCRCRPPAGRRPSCRGRCRSSSSPCRRLRHCCWRRRRGPPRPVGRRRSPAPRRR